MCIGDVCVCMSAMDARIYHDKAAINVVELCRVPTGKHTQLNCQLPQFGASMALGPQSTAGEFELA